MEIRQINWQDAEEFLAMQKQLDQESPYMLLKPDERKITAEEMQKRILHLNKIKDFLMIILNDDKKIVGYLQAERAVPLKIRHSAYIVVGLLKEVRGKGYGTLLFQELSDWAVQEKIVRLELTVMVKNKAAVILYKKAGFEIEGIKKQSIFQDNNYMDEYYMSKIIN